jgi:2-C-methyl-D-erythritol 2,4-cyclodiphosphate synthase
LGVRFSPAARKAIDFALQEAERRGHASLGTTHLLLGLLERGTAAPVALAATGVDVATLREKLDASLVMGYHPADDGVTVDDALEAVLQRASELSIARGGEQVTDADVLAACAESTHGAGALLAEAGLQAQRLKELAPALSGEERATQPAPAVVTRVGNGYDSHRFAPGGPMRLGGIDVPSDVRLVGHSDGDAIAHALTDAILGAAAAGDIGEMFADTDPANRGRDSIAMLRAAVARVHERGWRVQQADVTVIAERPKIGPHRAAMREILAGALGVAADAVSVKGKTNEGMGWIGRGEGLACIAVATIVSGGALAESREPRPESR